MSILRFATGTLAISIASLLPAQGAGPDQGTQQIPMQFATVRAQAAREQVTDLGQPPRSVADLPGHGPLPAIPEGPLGLPLADVPEATTMPAQGNTFNVSANDARIFSARQINSSGSRSNVAEPSVAIANNKTAAFATGNWFAAHSSNAGASWSTVNPYTRFPASDGGFCCDQRVLSTRQGPTFWYLQYIRSSAGNNRGRVAVSKSASDLQANRWSHYYDFTAQTFGFSSGHWLDFPDIAQSNNQIWFASNVFRGGSYVDSIIWTTKIAPMVAGSGLSIGFGKGSVIGGSSFRLTQGATTRMYWASHQSSTQLRVGFANEGAGFSRETKTISRWSGAAKVVRDRNGNNWAARADSRITGAFYSGKHFGFAWHSAPVTGRPQPHVRLVTFDSTTRALEVDTQIWSSSLAWMYPAVGANPDGGLGIKVAVQATNGTEYPNMAALLYDDLGFSGGLVYARGTSSTGAVFGDYLTANHHPAASIINTFYGSGMARIGSMRSYLVHFGREAYRSGFIGLAVRSSPRGIPITATNDRFGQGPGTAPFLRSYAFNTFFTLTAPTTRTVSGVPYVFDRWDWVGTPGGSITRVTTPSFRRSIGGAADNAEAVYKRRRTLAVRSTNPTSGTTITVTPNDINGRGTGSTAMTRFYKDDATVTLTAPSVRGINPFSRWVLNGRAQTTGARTLRVTMNRDNTVVAEYRVRTRGTFTSYGTGCPGTGGQRPLHSGSGTPEVGNTMRWNLSRARPNSSARIWLGAPQAISLAPFGMPGCTWLASRIASFSATTNGSGSAQVSVPIANNTAWIGANLYTQCLVIDPGAPTPTKIVWSNGLRTFLGGVR